jgi:phosphate transport system protein
VLWADRLATAVITAGGVLVVGAVLLIGVFLVLKAAPLFQGAEVAALPPASPDGPVSAGDVLMAECDEHLTQLAVLDRGGSLRVYSGLLRDGSVGPESFPAAVTAVAPVFARDRRVTAFARAPVGGHTAFAFADGSLSLGRIGFRSEVLPRAAVAGDALKMAVGGRSVIGGKVFERLPNDLWRTTEADVEMKELADVPGSAGPVVAMDYRLTAGGRAAVLILVRRMLDQAVEGLAVRDPAVAGERAAAVADADGEIDSAEVRIEENCLKLPALYQPVAGDLRLIAAVLKVNEQLERAADHAVNIARLVRDVARIGVVSFPPAVVDLARRVGRVCEVALRAFLATDSAAAAAVCRGDDHIDELERAVADEAAEIGRHNVRHALLFARLGHELERIGDLMTNIAEDTVYLVTGEIVRHRAGTLSGGRGRPA